MTIEFPPCVAEPLGSRAAHRLVALTCMLALVLLGLTMPGHSHASDLTRQQASVAASASDSGDHCPVPTDTSGPGHCHASNYGHACCILFAATRAAEPAVTRKWAQTREFQLASIVTAPNPRPPAPLAT